LQIFSESDEHVGKDSLHLVHDDPLRTMMRSLLTG
jgi:hypothetical protein